ncbi:MAG: GDP-mannose 4,6-dehydratase [Salegentibacter mishustinae]|nr:GDP-mannose 4,6-dehydratase [Salegentibacter mishustinae]
MDKQRVLVTGAAGFIGFHLVNCLVKLNFEVVGLDNINNYYDPTLKYDRLKELGIEKDSSKEFFSLTKSSKYKNFSFVRMNIEDRKNLPHLFKEYNFSIVVNLAAQAGVRYSIDNPEAYIDSNLVGFANILECCRHSKVEHLVFASSSSVYGQNENVPFSTNDRVDQPISLYAATKKSNELMAYTYSHLYNLKVTGLRFFTVYGPWGRPDMAMFLFTDAIVKGNPIKVFNSGNLERDFTFIDDIIEGVTAVLQEKSNNSSYSLYNIGNSKPVKLLDFIDAIEEQLGIRARKEMRPMQPGDVSKTWADLSSLKSDFNYIPKTSIKEGVSQFIEWYKKYYHQKSDN